MSKQSLICNLHVTSSLSCQYWFEKNPQTMAILTITTVTVSIDIFVSHINLEWIKPTSRKIIMWTKTQLIDKIITKRCMISYHSPLCDTVVEAIHNVPRFRVSCVKLVIFLLYNNLFIYQVLCILIYSRSSLYSFLKHGLIHSTKPARTTQSNIREKLPRLMIILWLISLTGIQWQISFCNYWRIN